MGRAVSNRHYLLLRGAVSPFFLESNFPFLLSHFDSVTNGMAPQPTLRRALRHFLLHFVLFGSLYEPFSFFPAL